MVRAWIQAAADHEKWGASPWQGLVCAYISVLVLGQYSPSSHVRDLCSLYPKIAGWFTPRCLPEVVRRFGLRK